MQPNQTKTTNSRMEEDGSASPKSLLLRGPTAGICEGDGSSPRLHRALAAAAAGGYHDNYMMRMVQAGVVEPRCRWPPGIKQQRRPRHEEAEDAGELAALPPSSGKLLKFLGFVVAPGPAASCCRDHPFEVRTYT